MTAVAPLPQNQGADDRAVIVAALVAEVLGPRGGANEYLPDSEDPRDEYISGVLKSAMADGTVDVAELQNDVLPTDFVVEGELPTEMDDEDSAEDGGVLAMGSPTLDPRALPSTIGLSFVISSEHQHWPISLCATWARYVVEGSGWRRVPGHFVSGVVDANADVEWTIAPGLRLIMRTRQITSERRSISVYLINETPLNGMQPWDTRTHVFQPEIRVKCGDDAVLVPVDLPSADSSRTTQDAREADALAMLYRGKMALARGHLCGAYWSQIDPQRPCDSRSFLKPPFYWVDGEVLSDADRAHFALPDVRTDLTPCIPVESPTIDWDERWGLPPQRSAEILSETFDPADLEAALRPLQHGYESWIDAQTVETQQLNESDRSSAEFNLSQCSQAAARIGAAIDLLTTDGDVRLAFCFANKAIALQARWKGISDFRWHTFQLAFLLLNVVGVSRPSSPDRDICDLLWFPTGGGKTEAYLGLAAFCLAYRRRMITPGATASSPYRGGVAVISRYTLRLLSIQQFRRALAMVTACEQLRAVGLRGDQVGWHPQRYVAADGFLWGTTRFSIGLWVGNALTPNHILTITYRDEQGHIQHTLGAVDILKGARPNYDGPDAALRRLLRYGRILGDQQGEPAQVLSCPACNAVLSVPDEGYDPNRYVLHFALEGAAAAVPPQLHDPSGTFDVVGTAHRIHANAASSTLSLTIVSRGDRRLEPENVDRFFYEAVLPQLGPATRLACARPARPGYFISSYETNHSTLRDCDFDIYCPNPECPLASPFWAEQVPLSRLASAQPQRRGSSGERRGTMGSVQDGLPYLSGLHWQTVPACFAVNDSKTIADRSPIPAYTVDDQIYHRIPSLIVATVDKFARLPFEPKAAAIFGNVEYYHARWGYYREHCPPDDFGSLPDEARAHPAGGGRRYNLHTAVSRFAPPEVIIQDELHLIEGPLGSLTGLYETAIDMLCSVGDSTSAARPKYIASTATVRQAHEQVQSLFDRRLAQFPPAGMTIDDRFFAQERLSHPLESDNPGRLYVGVAAPGKGVQTPNVRIWSALLQEGYVRWRGAPSESTDQFYTLVGYFNAIRELASGLSLIRQDIPDWMDHRWGNNRRPDLDVHIELSSRKSSTELPSMLAKLGGVAPAAADAVFATSMFGTGVDVDRLGLMVMHGQPKSTAAYIQATGRVGRTAGGIVVALLRASRPRDLAHYEYFTAYHRALYRYVEPVTVAPFSSRARERALGPLCVAILRNAAFVGRYSVDHRWRVQQRLSQARFFCHANVMAILRRDPAVQVLVPIFERRSQTQPASRRPMQHSTSRETTSELDRWHAIAYRNANGTDSLVYYESAFVRQPSRAVVLGDAYHSRLGLDQVYRNAPQTMRDVEETTGFKI